MQNIETPIGYGLPGMPGVTTTNQLERFVLKPAVRTTEFWGLQSAAVLPWLADAFSAAPLPLWIKVVVSAACQVALAIARAWPKSRVGEAISKLPIPALPPVVPTGTLPTSSPPYNPTAR